MLFLMKIKGFTLIELLVVIVIIGVLATIATSTYSGFLEDTKRTKVVAELKQIHDLILAARIIEDKPLREITGSDCSNCVCRERDLRNVSESDACFVAWNTVLQTLGGIVGTDVSEIVRDPWGSPYLLDENDEEPGDPLCVRKDFLSSVGPDGITGINGSLPETAIDNENLFIDNYRCN